MKPDSQMKEVFGRFVLSSMGTSINHKLNYDMPTPWSENLPDIPWNIYPRPQLERDSFFCLNGKWHLVCRNEKTKAEEDWGDILVPFPPESALSGIKKTPESSDVLVYSRSFVLPEGFLKDRVLLHFGAADQIADVELNGQTIGHHEGGYLPFTLDITESLRPEENRLTVYVRDPLDTDYPVGKQRASRGGIWYTPFSGLWQTVWMESVPAQYIQAIRLKPWYDHVVINLVGPEIENLEKELIVYSDFGEEHFKFTGLSFTYTPRHPRTWTPDTPYIYNCSIRMANDTIRSYFALRSIAIGTSDSGLHKDIPRVYVNGSPFFFHGVLDQGYFSDGIALPASPEGYVSDIRHMKECGFNTIRKHLKVEPEIFYAECDRQGILVLQDIVNSGDYHFFSESLVPTVLASSHHRKYKPVSEKRRAIYEEQLRGTLDTLYSHPCIFGYTLFNEAWGQFDSEAEYALAKSIDDTRIYDTASGWFTSEKTDINSQHIYFGNLPKQLEKAKNDKPLFLTEFGGIAYPIKNHSFNSSFHFGYRLAKSSDDLAKRLFKLYKEVIIPGISKGLTGAIYTQLSDVEDEVNGLLTYDRQMMKAFPETLQEISRQIKAIINLRMSDTEEAREKVLEPGGILLLGDSITDMFPTERMLKDYRVYNRGFSGDRSGNLLSKLPATLGPLRPDKIIILIGANDIGHGLNENDVEGNLRQVAEYIRIHAPQAKVHLLSTLPTNANVKLDMPKHEEFTSVRPNSKILPLVARQEALAKEFGWTFHDFASAYKDEDGNMKEALTLEGLHLNEAGYEVYVSMLKPILDE